MSEMFDGEHDAIPTGELEKCVAQNTVFLRAKYSGDVADLRADFISKLLRHDALHDGVGYAVFDVVPPESGSVVIDSNPKDILVWFARLDPENIVPSIRIFTNEVFTSSEATLVMTEDVTINSDDVAIVLVDAFEIVNGNELANKVESKVVCDGDIAEQVCFAPFFQVTPDGLERGQLFSNTPIFEVTEMIEGAEYRIEPFGSPYCLEDKIYALSAARGLFEQIKNRTPTLCSLA